ncbi:hypothetical protein [Microbacterium sp. SLBN-146]|uniref:hypothetical protein n=1 Tax=Microbacterium sp. SLBN-146 TaxID=2768457 RepID=UPI00115004CB|nr:hypothetical protein [Microbacterium sp. SLBN-146]TQJ32170.1 hypothetical protein FBY39_2674 [Microbacterium sp. SLBN-146]
MPSPFLYFADERLSIAELSAARLDGHVVELGDAYIPADAVETAALRAGSLRYVLKDTLAATHLTAAWVHGAALVPPVRHTVQRAVRRRLHAVIGVSLVYRDVALPLDDLQLIGGVWVTTPARTLADLVRIGDHAHTEVAQTLLHDVPGVGEQAEAWLAEHRGIRNRRPGIALLAKLLAAQEEVTR